MFIIDTEAEERLCANNFYKENPQAFINMRNRRLKEVNNFSQNWERWDLKEAVNRFIPNAKRESVNKSGKIYFSNDLNLIIDYDIFGDYFRIFDKTKNIKNSYFIIGDNNSLISFNESGLTKENFLEKSHYRRI